MGGITEFFSPEAGLRRRAWLDGIDSQVSEAARYYLGPTGLPERVGAAATVAGMFSPGADFVEAATASGDIMRARTPMEAATAGAGMVGALGSMFIPSNVNRMADELTKFGADEAGALRLFTGGSGDPMAAAADRGAWFSETPDLAREYAGPSGVVREFDVDPKRQIAFRHAEQRRPIGDLVSQAVEGAGDITDDMARRVSPILDRLYGRYGNEARPLFEFWNRDRDVADMFRGLGYDAISTAEKSDMKAQTWGVLDPRIMQPAPTKASGLLSQARDSLARKEATTAELAAAGRPVQFSNGLVDAVAGPDPSRPGKFRVSYIGQDGQPNGHAEFDTLQAAIRRALDDQLQPVVRQK